MTRIVTSVPRPKRPPKKRKAVALAVPAIVTAKRSRHPLRAKQAAAEVGSCPNPTEAAQPSTPRDSERDPIAANDDRKPAIVTSTSISRKRQKHLHAYPTAAEPGDDPKDDPKGEALVKAFMARMIRPPNRVD